MTPDQLKLLKELAKLGDVLYLTKPKKDLIIDAIASMNISALKILLDDDKTYIDTTKEIFLNGLSNLFEDFKKDDETELVVVNGFCGNKACSNCGVNGYRFVGVKSKKYFDFIFEMDGEHVREIGDCFLLKTKKEPVEYGDPVYIEIKNDERSDFKKTPEYCKFYHDTQTAINEITSNQESPLTIEKIDYFITKYTLLYDCIKNNEEYNSTQMKWDYFLWIIEIFTDFKNYASTKDILGIITAKNNLEQISNEEELLEWVLKNEEEYNKIPCFLLIITQEKDSKYSCRISEKVYFTGEPFRIIFDFISSYNKHKQELLEKYTTCTEDEFIEDYNITDVNQYMDFLSLQFHLNKRKELASLGITLPFYLAKS